MEETTTVYEGKLNTNNLSVAIVASRFNDFIVDKLIKSSVDCLKRHGSPRKINIYRCPGSFEIPFVVKQVITYHKPDSVVALGSLIRGGTIHFDLIASSVVSDLSRLSLEMQTPIGLGILTTETIEQAIERAGTKAGNKGWEATMAAIEMTSLVKSLHDKS